MRPAASQLRLLVPYIFGAIFVVGILELTGLIRPMRSFAVSLTEPLTTRLYAFSADLHAHVTAPTDVSALQAETERLRDENVDLKEQISALQTAEQENTTLRQLLDFFEQDTKDLPHVLSRIASRDPENPQIIILNAGARDGVEVGNAVVVKDGVLIAKIIDVYAKSSRALLLTDNDSRVAVTISGGNPTSKLVHGERGLSLILDQVPQQETMTVGQLVITSGLEPGIPRGLIVGEIEQKISENNDLFQQAILRPLVDYDSASLVAVVLSPNT